VFVVVRRGDKTEMNGIVCRCVLLWKHNFVKTISAENHS
jgi:hypothetical protein